MLQFSAKPQIVADPRNIRIVETTPGGARRPMMGPGLGQNEYLTEDRDGAVEAPRISSTGEAGVIDMSGAGEFQVLLLKIILLYLKHLC